MGSPNVLGLASLQGAYDASGSAPHILNSIANGAFSVQQDAAAAVADITQYRDAAGVVQHSWQDDSLTLGPAVTDIFADSLSGVNFTPALFPTRPTLNIDLDVLALIPTSRTFTSGVNKITFGSGAVFTLDFLNATTAAALIVNPRVVYNQDGNAFGSGTVVNHSTIYEGDSGSTRFIGPIFTFVHQPRIRASGAGSVVNHAQGRDFLSQPVYSAVNGATSYLMTGPWTQFFGQGQVLANATITFRRIFFAGAILPAPAGTVIDQTALLIDNLTPQTTNPAMGIENNIASPGIQYQGGTGLWGVFGATPVAQPAAYVVTNPVDRRSFDTTTITLPQLAEVVGTLIADDQAFGWKA